jgi:hypothetical protein
MARQDGKHSSALGSHGRAVAMGDVGAASPHAQTAVRIMPERGGAESVIDDYLAHKPDVNSHPVPVAPWSATYPMGASPESEYTDSDPAAAAAP